MTDKPSRFTGLLKVAKTEPAATAGGEPLAKSKDPDFIKVNYYFPKSLNRRLKQAAVVSDRELSDLAQQAVEEFLDKYFPSD